jgi:hypothetical protein
MCAKSTKETPLLAGVKLPSAAGFLLRRRSWTCGVVFSICISCLDASPATWTFAPSKVGRALHEGGWTVEYLLGQVNASPEFSFPLQLIYRNNREQAGMFGSQWWCPQLESTVLPRGPGVLVWTMPSGGMVGFKEDERRAGDFRSFDGNWQARMSANRVNIINAEGWQYGYSRGRLDSVTSPTGRVLEFAWAGDRFQGIQLRDVASGTRLVLAQATYGENRRLGALELTGQAPHRFAYAKDGREERLVGWAPPIGRSVGFVYHPESKVLARTMLGDGKDPADIAEFRTEFVPPFEGDKPKNNPEAKRNPGNWWLVAGIFSESDYKSCRWRRTDVYKNSEFCVERNGAL